MKVTIVYNKDTDSAEITAKTSLYGLFKRLENYIAVPKGEAHKDRWEIRLKRNNVKAHPMIAEALQRAVAEHVGNLRLQMIIAEEEAAAIHAAYLKDDEEDDE